MGTTDRLAVTGCSDCSKGEDQRIMSTIRIRSPYEVRKRVPRKREENVTRRIRRGPAVDMTRSFLFLNFTWESCCHGRLCPAESMQAR